MIKVGRTSRIAASACQPMPSVKARLFSDGLNTDGASQCSGKSTNIPTKLVPITMVRICTSPNTASAAAKPVSMPAANGTTSQNTRTLRNTHSSKVKVSSKPAALIKRLSLLAAALEAAAYTAPPALKVSTPPWPPARGFVAAAAANPRCRWRYYWFAAACRATIPRFCPPRLR